MTTTDTRAALDAAIDAAIHSIRTTDSMLSARTAIALIVADEVSLRLAAAPTVEDAIGALERDAYAHGKVPGTPAGLDLAVARERDRNALRTAIVAHVTAEVARALAAAPGVEEAIAKLSSAEVIADRPGTSDDVVAAELEAYAARTALRAAIAADRARAVAEARPTPDEARRLVGEAIDAVRSIHDRADPYRQPAVADLLRALGVEP